MAKLWVDGFKALTRQKNHSINKSVDKGNILDDAFFGGILIASEKKSASASRPKERSVSGPIITSTFSHIDLDLFSTHTTSSISSSNSSSTTSSTQSWETLPIHVTNPRRSPAFHRPNLHPLARRSSGVGDVRQLRNLSEAVESQCSVCAEDLRRDEYPSAPITSACTHPTTDVCKQCMRTYIGSELSNRGTAAMSCPICREEMSYFDVKRNATPEDFNRYDERTVIESLQNEPGFRWCPHRGCPGGQIQAYGDAEPKVTCNHCHKPFCFTHRVQWHTGLTCRQYDEMPELARQMREAEEEAERAAEDEAERAAEEGRLAASREAIRERQRAAEDRERRKAEEREGEAYVQNSTKRCPHCDSPTERNGGCKHMTCMLKLQDSLLAQSHG